MAAIGVGIAMSVLDGAIANIALPTLARQLHATPSATVWVVNAYQLVIVSGLLPLATLGEKVGYRRVYLAGLAAFTVGSFACAFSPNLPLLVTARSLQGLGAAGLMSVNGALVRFTYPQAKLGSGVGLNALVVAASAAVGPSLASAILAAASWPWLFLVNVPLGVVALIISARALPASPLSGRRFDLPSAVLNVATFGLLFLGVDALTHGRDGHAFGAFEVLASMVAAVAMVWRAARQKRPLIPIDLLRLPVFSLSVITSICAFTTYMLAFLALPFYFEGTLHKSAVETGLLMTPWPLALALAAPVAGRLSDRMAPAWLGAAGMTVLAAGLLLVAFLPAHPAVWDIAWRLALSGLGFGFFQAPNNRTLLGSAPRERSGAAGGMLAVARLLGMTIGATVVAALLRGFPGAAERTSLLIGAGLSIIAAGLSVSRRSAA